MEYGGSTPYSTSGRSPDALVISENDVRAVTKK